MPISRPVIGPYEILEVVGKGGMATVYRGRSRETGQVVAIKLMEPTAAANAVLVKRFEQEYAAAIRLRHPNLIQVWDYGLDEARPYLVMEFMDGQSLGRRITREGPLPEAEAVRIVLQVADGLAAAHRAHMIHRDVKPDNVLLSRDGQAKLSDLGLIKDLAAKDGLTQTRTRLGTIAFVAPEQFEDAKRADVRSDIYGLGATLYHAATGVAPFQGKRTLQILSKKFRNDFTSPRGLVPSLSRQVDAAICKALDASPENRHGSCREFMESLAPRGAAGGRAWAEAACSPEPLVPVVEQRESIRYPADLRATCKAVQGGFDGWKAKIQDISWTGIRLILNRRFEPGAVLSVDLQDSKTGVFPTLYAKVIWVQPTGARLYTVGCRLKRKLDPAEMETLLGDKPLTVLIHAG
jgi:serine/threonine protein kinase